jgi:hypothetical protein
VPLDNENPAGQKLRIKRNSSIYIIISSSLMFIYSYAYRGILSEALKIINGTKLVHHVFVDFEKAHDSVDRILFVVLIENFMTMKLIRLMKMCLNETCYKVRWIFCLELSETRRCFIAIVFKLWFRICHQEGPRKSGRIWIEWNTSSRDLCQWC